MKVLADFIGGCGAGRLYCALQPNGDVSPCVFMPNLKLGNLRQERFMDIWHNNRTLIKLRDRSSLHGNCGKCGYKFICGGCRARALVYFDDLFAPDPGCTLTKLGPQVTAPLPIVISQELRSARCGELRAPSTR
jgi:radical SAM protein with 4Fe4S-binding SPASM domain